MPEYIIVALTAATGFVVAGVIASFHQLVTETHASFELEEEAFSKRLWRAFVIVFCGPVILMRNALRGRIIERRPAYWLLLTAIIATGWSFCSGIFVLQLVLAI